MGSSTPRLVPETQKPVGVTWFKHGSTKLKLRHPLARQKHAPPVCFSAEILVLQPASKAESTHQKWRGLVQIPTGKRLGFAKQSAPTISNLLTPWFQGSTGIEILTYAWTIGSQLKNQRLSCSHRLSSPVQVIFVRLWGFENVLKPWISSMHVERHDVCCTFSCRWLHKYWVWSIFQPGAAMCAGVCSDGPRG